MFLLLVDEWKGILNNTTKGAQRIQKEKRRMFFFCGTGHIGSSLQNKTYENKTYEKKALVTSLDLFVPFLWWRKEKRYVVQLGFLS